MASATSPALTIKTNFTPPITVNPLSKSVTPFDFKPLFSILQPTIDGDFGVIGKVHYAPEGEASSYGGIIFIAMIALAAYGAFHLAKKVL